MKLLSRTRSCLWFAVLWTCGWAVVAEGVISLVQDGNTTTSSPAPTVSLTPTPANVSVSPTVSPGNGTMSPAPTPAADGNATVSPAPSSAPTPSKNETESPSPTRAPDTPTSTPTPSPTTSKPTDAPVTAPPTAAPTPVVPDDHHGGISIWKIIGKSIAWMILAGLSMVAFGACMTHRYRIYYFMRGLWYTFLRLECTQWTLRKLRLDGYFYGSSGVGGGRGSSNYTSLNEIIFDSTLGDLQEGLLMRET